jgi:hypothetical protein
VTAQPSTAFDPSTGEIGPDFLTPDQLNAHISELASRLERSALVEKAKADEMGHVQNEHDKVYRRAYRASDASSEKGRCIDAEIACDATFCPDRCNETLSLATRLTVLKAEVKALKDVAHNMRAVLSAYQSISSNTRSAFGAGGGHR